MSVSAHPILGVLVALLAPLCALRAAPQVGPDKKPATRPPYSIAPNGLVVPDTEAKANRAKGRVRSDFEEPAVPAPASGGSAPFAKPAPAAAGTHEEAPAASRTKPQENLDLGSALLDVFQRVGHPSALTGVGALVVKMRVTVFDSYGAELAVREMVHEADLSAQSRDRLNFTAAQKSYGRDGGAIWVVHHGMDWPALEQEAREELELFGLLLRAPWCFADTQRFIVFPRETVVADGRRLAKIRIETRGEGDDLIGPRDRKPSTDAYEVLCPTDSYEPTELRILRANGGKRTVKLLDWREVGGVRMPMRRVFTTPDGVQALEIVTTQVDQRQSLSDSRFRPPAR